MAESQNAVQRAIIERLQAQERVVVKTVDERLQGFSKLVGERLTDSNTKSQAALADLRERLAVIDKAQKNLTEISTDRKRVVEGKRESAHVDHGGDRIIKKKN